METDGKHRRRPLFCHFHKGVKVPQLAFFIAPLIYLLAILHAKHLVCIKEDHTPAITCMPLSGFLRFNGPRELSWCPPRGGSAGLGEAILQSAREASLCRNHLISNLITYMCD